VSLIPSENHSQFKEWLYLQADGMLGGEDRRRLESHMAVCEECRRERREATRLLDLLGEAVVAVDTGLAGRVMSSLPEAGWESKSAASWRLAVAVFALLGTGAAVLGLGETSADVPVAGAALALASLFRSALLAGGGLLAASWTGLGLALDELFAGSRVAFAVFALLVFGIDVLFLRLVLRRRLRQMESKVESEPPTHR